MTMRPFDLSELDQLESDWRVRHADKYEFRALPGVEKVARMHSHEDAASPATDGAPTAHAEAKRLGD